MFDQIDSGGSCRGLPHQHAGHHPCVATAVFIAALAASRRTAWKGLINTEQGCFTLLFEARAPCLGEEKKRSKNIFGLMNV